MEYVYFNRPSGRKLRIKIGSCDEIMMPALSSKLLIENVRIRKGESVLDLGTGSGVVAIAAKMLGAGYVLGTDILCRAVEEARLNCMLNGVEVDVYVVEIVPDDFPF